jgi:predicted RNA-binding Zn-ribbon protein involved in translation (DUF1610 family)
MEPLLSGGRTEKGMAEASLNAVAADARCLSCGYDLSGLASAGVCPECGRAIAESTTDRPFPFLDDANAARLYTGLRRIPRAFALALATVPVVFFAFALEAVPLLLVAILVGLAAWVYWVVGWCLVARVRAPVLGAGAQLIRQTALVGAWTQVVGTVATAAGLLAGDPAAPAVLLGLGFLVSTTFGGLWLDLISRRERMLQLSPASAFGNVLAVPATVCTILAAVGDAIGVEPMIVLFGLPAAFLWLLAVLSLWVIAVETLGRLRSRGEPPFSVSDGLGPPVRL